MEVGLQKPINQSINNPKQSPATVFHNALRLMWNLSTSVQIIPEDSLLQGNVNWHQVKVKHADANIHRNSKLLANPGRRSMSAECLEQ